MGWAWLDSVLLMVETHVGKWAITKSVVESIHNWQRPLVKSGSRGPWNMCALKFVAPMQGNSTYPTWVQWETPNCFPFWFEMGHIGVDGLQLKPDWNRGVISQNREQGIQVSGGERLVAMDCLHASCRDGILLACAIKCYCRGPKWHLETTYLSKGQRMLFSSFYWQNAEEGMFALHLWVLCMLLWSVLHQIARITLTHHWPIAQWEVHQPRHLPACVFYRWKSPPSHGVTRRRLVAGLGLSLLFLT